MDNNSWVSAYTEATLRCIRSDMCSVADEPVYSFTVEGDINPKSSLYDDFCKLRTDSEWLPDVSNTLNTMISLSNNFKGVTSDAMLLEMQAVNGRFIDMLIGRSEVIDGLLTTFISKHNEDWAKYLKDCISYNAHRLAHINKCVSVEELVSI